MGSWKIYICRVLFILFGGGGSQHSVFSSDRHFWNRFERGKWGIQTIFITSLNVFEEDRQYTLPQGRRTSKEDHES